MKRLCSIAAAIVALALLASPASAQSKSWTGVYVSGGAGYAIGTTEADLYAPGIGSVLNVDSLASQGRAFDARVGGDFQLSNTPITVGLFGSLNRGAADFDLSVPIAGVSIISASIEEQYQAGARIGYANGNSLLYVGAYLSRGEFKWSLVNGALSGKTDLDGKGLLAGIETRIGDKGFTGGIEYTLTQFDTSTYALGGIAALDLDHTVHTVKVRGGYRFDWATAVGLK